MNSRMTRLLLAALSFLIAHHSARAQGGEREITVSVSIRTWDTGPVEGWGMYLHSTKGDFWGETDEKGVAVFRAKVTDDEQRVNINIEGVVSRPRPNQKEPGQTQMSYDLHTRYYFPFFSIHNFDLYVNLEPGKADYALELVAQPAVKATAIIVDSNRGVPVNTGLVFRRVASESMMHGRVSRSGEMLAPGLPPNQANEVYLYVPPFVYWFPLTAQQTAQDVDLGKVYLDLQFDDRFGNITKRQPRPKSTLDVVKIRGSGFKEATEMLNPRIGVYGVLLISLDATIVIALDADDDHTAGWMFRNCKERPDIPAGEYYALPGMFDVMDFQLAALDAVRAGHDLTQWGIPNLTIEGGDKPQQFTFDAAETAKAVQNMMKALTPAPAPTTAPATQPASP